MIAYLRWGVMRTDGTQWRELEEMQAEAQRLAEAAGEGEVWRIRVVDLFWLYWRDDVCAEEIARTRGEPRRRRLFRGARALAPHQALGRLPKRAASLRRATSTTIWSS